MPNNRKIKKIRGGKKPIWTPDYLPAPVDGTITNEKIIQVLTELYNRK